MRIREHKIVWVLRGGVPFCGKTKGREREAVDCGFVLGQEKNLSGPRTGERETRRVPVSTLQTALGAEEWRFQKCMTLQTMCMCMC